MANSLQSPARHGGVRLERTSGQGVLAGRPYVSTTHKSFSPPGAVSALFGEHAIDSPELSARAMERTQPERRLRVMNAAVGDEKKPLYGNEGCLEHRTSLPVKAQ